MSIYSGAIVDKLEYYLRKYFKWDAVLDNCLDGCGMCRNFRLCCNAFDY